LYQFIFEREFTFTNNKRKNIAGFSTLELLTVKTTVLGNTIPVLGVKLTRA